MVQYLYSQSYETARANHITSSYEDSALLDARVYAVADKYNIGRLGDSAKAKFSEWAAQSSWHIGDFAQVIEKLWEKDEFYSIHTVIKEEMAKYINILLVSDALSLVNTGMRLRRFLAAFILRMVNEKNNAFTYQHALYRIERLKVHSMRKNIRGYKQVIEQVGNRLDIDACGSDESDGW
jgi:hypothetical protein